jgi:hypothetical protein
LCNNKAEFTKAGQAKEGKVIKNERGWNMAKKRANGESTAYKLPNGRWRAKITLGWDIVELEDGTKKKKRIVKTKSGFKTKREALEWIKQYKSQDDPIVNITFKELYDLWSKPHFKKVSKSTADGYRAAYKHCESIYWRQFNQLKTADLQKVVDDCPYGRRTKADIKSLMNNLYKYAIENDYINKNYAEFIKLEKKPKSKKDALRSMNGISCGKTTKTETILLGTF